MDFVNICNILIVTCIQASTELSIAQPFVYFTIPVPERRSRRLGLMDGRMAEDHSSFTISNLK